MKLSKVKALEALSFENIFHRESPVRLDLTAETEGIDNSNDPDDLDRQLLRVTLEKRAKE